MRNIENIKYKTLLLDGFIYWLGQGEIPVQ